MHTYEEQIVETVKKVMPSVVSIVVGKAYEEILRERPYELMVPHGDHVDMPLPEEALPHTQGGKVRIGGGSGFVCDALGLVLTNKHVVADPHAEYTIADADGETHQAEVIARDPLTDVAILKVAHCKLPALALSDKDGVELGQTVLAVGTALGEFQNTVSCGIISGLSRFITAMTDMEGHAERLHGLIQTDAAINPGNSGGPLVNLAGHVIGINSAVVFGAQNIGFAIPIGKARQDLYEVKKYGRIRRPFLGIRYMLLSPEIRKRFRLPVDYGALVLRENLSREPAVLPGSSAARAGMRDADVIVELNGKKIDAKTGVEEILEDVAIGAKIPVKILRNNKEEILTLVAEERKL